MPMRLDRRLLALAVLAIAPAACEVASPAPHAPPKTGKPAPLHSPPPLAAVVASAAVEDAPPPPPPRSPFAYANIDPSDDEIVGPPDVRASCEDDLAAAGIKFKHAELPVFVQKKSNITCGAPQVIMYRGSPEKIAYEPAVMLTCTMALALARFETILQDESQKTFGKRVVKIHHLGTYSCREMAAYPGWVSEHSYANAIDLADFLLEDGRTIDVLKDFKPKTALATNDKGTWLRDVAQRAYEEEVFSTVLTPFFNKFHASHFHVDLARFRSDGTTFWSDEL
jgi:hypothetical protein